MAGGWTPNTSGGSFTSSGGGGWTPNTTGRPSTKKGGHHGALGIVENLGGDIGSSVRGVGPALVKTAEAGAKDLAQAVTLNYGHPGRHEKSHLTKDVVKPLAKSYEQTYGPLAHGDVSKFLHGLYEHPLGPILDASALVTGGAGALAKAGTKLAEAGAISDASRIAKLAKPGEIKLRSPGAIKGQADAKVLTRPTSRNPVVRARQHGVHSALNKLPNDTPVLRHFGEVARYGREAQRVARQGKLRLSHSVEMRDYNAAIVKLSPKETVAMHLIGRAVDPSAYASVLKRYANQGRTVRPETLTLLRDPEVRQLYAKPTAAMEKAATAARALGDKIAQAKVEHGFLSPEAADEARYRHAKALSHPELLHKISQLEETLHASGVTRPADLASAVADATRKLRDNLGEQRRYRVPPAQREPGQTAVGVKPDATLAKLRREESQLRTRLDDLGEIGRLERLEATSRAATAKIKQRLEGTPREPFYLPDVAVIDENAARRLNQNAGAGRGVVQNPVHHSRLVLFKMGQLQLGKDTLGPQFFRDVKSAHADDVHNLLLESAIRIPKGSPLPEGYVYLRRRIGKTPEQIPHTEKTLGDFERSFETFAIKHGQDAEQAATHLDHRLVAPEHFVRQVTGEFARSHSAIRQFIGKPMEVWRALVLGARPAFLVNNVIGNHLLYALKYAGPAGIRGYLDAVRREHGEGMVRTLINERGVPRALHDELMREYFPEQVAGTFGSTQRVGGKVGRVTRKVGAGVLPATQALAEGHLRRAAVLAGLRASPEVKRILVEMPKQTRDFETAARQALDRNPQLAREISDKANDALGDYLSASPFERNVLRQAAPFIAWYKAIVRITGKLALDQPGRAVLLARLGQVYADMTQSELGPIPTDFQTLLAQKPASNGYQQVLNTSGVNPFQTVAQLGGAAASALGGAPGTGAREISGLLSPFVTSPVEWATGQSLFTGSPVKSGNLARGLVGGTVAGIGAGLPETRIIQAATHTGPFARGAKPGIYKRNLRTELLGAAGYPQKQLNLALAHKIAKPRKP